MPEGIREKAKWLDPFTYVDLFIIPKVRAMLPKQQFAVFLCCFAFLSILASLVFGFTPALVLAVAVLFAYLYFFEKDEYPVLAVYVVSAFIFAFILYFFVLSFLLGTSSPLVIVFSGSMQPLLYRGDIVILGSLGSPVLAEAVVDFPVSEKLVSEYAQIGSRLTQKGLRQASLKIGDDEYEFDEDGPIVIYYSDLQKRDIIHRAVLLLKAPDGDFLITFGDNNTRIDQDCGTAPSETGCISAYAVPVPAVKGRYIFHIPFLGRLKLFFFDDIPSLFR